MEVGYIVALVFLFSLAAWVLISALRKPFERCKIPDIPIPPPKTKCPTCHGSKTVEVHETLLKHNKKSTRVFMEGCEDCNGTGYVTEYTKSVYEI